MKFRNVSAVILLASVSVVGLSGCKKISELASHVSNGGDALGLSASAKLDAYAEAYNSLVDTFGLEEEYKNYREAEITNKSATDTISGVSKGWIEQGRDKLKAARAMSGGTPADLDAAADQLLAALNTVDTRLGGLEVYYSSGAYHNDGLARGKTEDPLMLADFAAADKALSAFNTLLDRELSRRDQAELARLKDGDPLLYQTKLALSQAKGVLALFHNTEALNDQEQLREADSRVAILEQTLAAQRAAREKAKADNKNPAADYEIIDTDLTQMIGDYRDMRRDHNISNFKAVIDEYNNAIQASNNLQS